MPPRQSCEKAFFTGKKRKEEEEEEEVGTNRPICHYCTPLLLDSKAQQPRN